MASQDLASAQELLDLTFQCKLGGVSAVEARGEQAWLRESLGRGRDHAWQLCSDPSPPCSSRMDQEKKAKFDLHLGDISEPNFDSSRFPKHSLIGVPQPWRL